MFFAIRRLDLNLDPLMSEATALSTVPQRLARWKCFIKTRRDAL